MATVARQTRPAPRYDDDVEARPSPAAYRAPHTRRVAARRSRLVRTFVVFVTCLTLLAVGRVALSFAVVQKTLQTDAVVREERRLTADNAALQEDLAQLSSTVRIRHIAETQLGLVDASHVVYLRPGKVGKAVRVATR